MKRFKMTLVRAQVIFDLKDDLLYWANNDASPVRLHGLLVGSKNKNGIGVVTQFLGEVYAVSDLTCLLKNGEWPAYEMAIICKVMAGRRVREIERRKDAEYNEMIENMMEIRLAAIDRIIAERAQA